MNTHLNLNKFIEYLDANPEIKPIAHFRAKAFVSDAPFQQGEIKPWGQVILYSAFVIFLTEENLQSGVTQSLPDILRAYQENGNLSLSNSDWLNDTSNLLSAISKVVVAPFQSTSLLEKALRSPYSFFITVKDIVNVSSGKQGMTQCYITIETPARKIHIRNGYIPRSPLVTFADWRKGLFRDWQGDFVEQLQNIKKASSSLVQDNPQLNEGSLPASTLPLTEGIPGMVTAKYGCAIYGDADSYKKDMYYGRTSEGAQVLLLDAGVCKDEFDLEIIKVRVLTNEWSDEVGKVGWISLDDTSFESYQGLKR